jgi:hypothetical protein
MMEAENIIAKLAEDRPALAVSVAWEEDPGFAWDGDGPDPAERGYYPHDVTVRVFSVRASNVIEGTASSKAPPTLAGAIPN